MKALYILALMTLVACGQNEDHKSAASATDNQDVHNPDSSKTNESKDEVSKKETDTQALTKTPAAKTPAYEPTKWVDPITGKNWSIDLANIYTTWNKDGKCPDGFRYPTKEEATALIVNGWMNQKSSNIFWTEEGLAASTDGKKVNFYSDAQAQAYCIEK